jgi:hypothetical protein
MIQSQHKGLNIKFFEIYQNHNGQLTLSNSIHEMLALINFNDKGEITYSKEWSKGCLNDLKTHFKDVLK